MIRVYNKPFLIKSLRNGEMAGEAIIVIANCITHLLDIQHLNITLSFCERIISDAPETFIQGRVSCLPYTSKSREHEYEKFIVRIYINAIKKSKWRNQQEQRYWAPLACQLLLHGMRQQ